MPSRNRNKNFVPSAYYHVYNRGVEKRQIYLDPQDYGTFLYLLKRYLGDVPEKNPGGGYYEWFGRRIELLSYCLMPNHFHLLFYQKDEQAITQLLHRISTSYTGYFNKKYSRIGPLFQDRFRASHIDSDAYLKHISRYIHLNPRSYEKYAWSSFACYLGDETASWVRPKRILDLFDGDYADFVADYKDHHDILEALKARLADL